MYEPKVHRPIPPERFVRRVLWHFAAALAVLAISLALGMAGYEYFESLPWRAAFLNAAMLMGGMGPVDPPKTNGGKVFAGLYALYAGLVFLAAAGLVFCTHTASPVAQISLGPRSVGFECQPATRA